MTRRRGGAELRPDGTFVFVVTAVGVGVVSTIAGGYFGLRATNQVCLPSRRQAGGNIR